MIRRLLLALLAVSVAGCATQYPNRNPVGEVFPAVEGQSLAQSEFAMPSEFRGRYVLLLLGYKQNSQFDIDRWLLGLDMTDTKVDVYELPATQGMLPRVFSAKIDNGMRAGIPRELWSNVVTLYEDGELLQAFTGNQNPNNARSLLLDPQGQVVFFHDRGFSVDALNDLRSVLNSAQG